jgi:hypothetical protein
VRERQRRISAERTRFEADGEGFEPSVDRKAHNGVRYRPGQTWPRWRLCGSSYTFEAGAASQLGFRFRHPPRSSLTRIPIAAQAPRSLLSRRRGGSSWHPVGSHAGPAIVDEQDCQAARLLLVRRGRLAGVDPEASWQPRKSSALARTPTVHRFAAPVKPERYASAPRPQPDMSDPEAQPRVGVREEPVVLRLEADGGGPHLVGR